VKARDDQPIPRLPPEEPVTSPGCRRPTRPGARIPGVDGSVLWRSAMIQAAAVAALSLLLAALLPHSFFEDWGWISGPVAWLGCAALTARLFRLPAAPVLIGAVLAGAASALAVVAGLHWLGVALAVGLFALWCARIAARTGRVAWS